MEREYAKLLKKQVELTQNDPARKLKQLQKRIEDMFQLLNLWTQYIEVIYMPESEIHIISALEKLDARPEDSAYSIRTQDNDIKRRINTLFNEKAGADQISEDEVDLKEDYETVNEGLTSDTTEGPA